jgi:hypothetical protein
MVRVSRFEPEVVRTLARRFWQGSEERVPTTPVWKVVAQGVALHSRYRKVEDFMRMGAMLDSVEPRWRSAILAIWCDSTPAIYRVTLRGHFREVAQLIGDQLGGGLASHQGILVQDPAGCTLYHLVSDWSAS